MTTAPLQQYHPTTTTIVDLSKETETVKTHKFPPLDLGTEADVIVSSTADTVSSNADVEEAATLQEAATPTSETVEVKLPNVKLAMAGGSWVAIQDAPEALAGRKGIPKRIAISLNTNDHVFACKRSEEIMRPYREKYVRAVLGDLKTFKGPDEFSTEPWPLQAVWSEIVDTAPDRSPVNFFDLVNRSKVDSRMLQRMVSVHQTLARHRTDPILRTSLPADAKDWEEVDEWHSAVAEEGRKAIKAAALARHNPKAG